MSGGSRGIGKEGKGDGRRGGGRSSREYGMVIGRRKVTKDESYVYN